MSERVESSELLNGFRQVIVYRQIIKQISSSANSTLVWGAIMFGLWFMVFSRIAQQNWKLLPLYSFIFLGLALGELTIGLWKKFFPSPHAFLLDAVVLLGFAAANAWRAYGQFVLNGRPETITFIFTIYMAYLAYREFKAWLLINRLLVYRPTREQLAQFDTFVRDVRHADPETESNALALKTRPELRALLLGDIAFFVASTGEVSVAHKNDVEIEVKENPEPSAPGQSKRAVLYLEDVHFGPFQLDSQNEANFAAWKANRS